MSQFIYFLLEHEFSWLEIIPTPRIPIKFIKLNSNLVLPLITLIWGVADQKRFSFKDIWWRRLFSRLLWFRRITQNKKRRISMEFLSILMRLNCDTASWFISKSQSVRISARNKVSVTMSFNVYSAANRSYSLHSSCTWCMK